MPRICIFGCRPPVSGPAITMHRIPNPARYPERFLDWVSLVGGTLSESDRTKYKSARVCDIHFSDGDRTRNSRLNIMAVPSLNLSESDRARNHVYERIHDDHTYFKSDSNNAVSDDMMQEIPEDSRPKKSQFIKEASKKNHEEEAVRYFCKEEGKYEITEDSYMEEISEENLYEEFIKKDIDADDDLGFNDLDRTDRQVDFDVVDDLGFDDVDALSFASISVNVSATDNGDVRSRSVKMDEGDDDVLDSGDDDDVVSVKPEDSGGKGDRERYVPQEHDGFRCNVCLGKIVGFRYRCCECVDYDMCSDCEFRGTHPLHFVLRVPGYRKQCEVGRVVAAVRVALAPPVEMKQEVVKIEAEDPGEKAVADPLNTELTQPSQRTRHTEQPETKVSTDNAIPPLGRLRTYGHPAKRPRGRETSNKHGGTSTLKVIADKNTLPELTHPSQRTRTRHTEQLDAEMSTDDVIPPLDLPAPPPAKKPRGREATNNHGGTSTLKVIADKHAIPIALDALKRRAFIRLENMKLPLQQNISKPAPVAVASVNRRRTCGKFNSKKKYSSPGIVSKRLSQRTYSKRNSREIALSLQNTSADSNNTLKVESPWNVDGVVETIEDEVFNMTEEEFDHLAARGSINEDVVNYESPGDDSLSNIICN